jgi:uncharacterized membrane protein
LASKLLALNLREHLTIYLLASLANGLLLFEQSQLASRAGLPVDIVGIALFQQLVMGILILGVLAASYSRTHRRWFYVIASILLAAYSGSRIASAFSASLELVRPLESKGIPISDYQGGFYLLALGAAISYVLMILLLRRAYGRLSSAQTVAGTRFLPAWPDPLTTAY